MGLNRPQPIDARSKRDGIRALKRQTSTAAYQQMLIDARRAGN